MVYVYLYASISDYLWDWKCDILMAFGQGAFPSKNRIAYLRSDKNCQSIIHVHISCLKRIQGFCPVIVPKGFRLSPQQLLSQLSHVWRELAMLDESLKHTAGVPWLGL